MPSAVRAQSLLSKSPPLSTASIRWRQSSSRAGGNSAARSSAFGAAPSDIASESRDRACHLLDEVFARDVLGIGEGLCAEPLDLVHIEAGRLQLADRGERAAQRAATQHAEQAAAARAVAAMASGELIGTWQLGEELADLLLVAL